MNPEVALIVGAIAAVAITIWLYIKVLPKKLNGTFDNEVFQFLHDFFHFKKLYLEEVLKVIFTVATVACITIGALLLVSTVDGYYYDVSMFPYGLALLIAGPVSLRLVYETLMMFILLVKNTIEINNKLKEPKDQE